MGSPHIGSQAVAHALPAHVPYLLAGCTAISTLSTDLFAPSIPSMPSAFGVDENTAQMVIGINLLAYALAQLIHGPLADRYGRRALLIIGFALFALSSVFCALAVSFDMLLAGRFAQGLFASVPSVVIVLMIRELYGEERAVGAMALYGAAIGIAPAVGPILGGYLEVWYGWQAGFLLVAGLAVLTMLAVLLSIPETLFAPRPLRARPVIESYVALLRRRAFLIAMIPPTMIFGAFFAFVTTGPHVLTVRYHVATEDYGLYFAIIILAYIVTTLIIRLLSDRFAAQAFLRMAVVTALAAAVILALPEAMGRGSLASLVLGMVFLGSSIGFVLTVGPLLMLGTVRDLAQGPASALLGSAQLGAGAIGSTISASFYDGTATSLTYTVAGFLIAAALPVVIFRHENTATT